MRTNALLLSPNSTHPGADPLGRRSVDVKRAARSSVCHCLVGCMVGRCRTTLAYTWPCNRRLSRASFASSRLRFPSPPSVHSLCVSVCERTQAKVGILQTRCLYARLRRRTAASGPGRVASCLILAAYPPAVYVPLDCQPALRTRLRQRKPASFCASCSS